MIDEWYAQIGPHLTMAHALGLSVCPSEISREQQ